MPFEELNHTADIMIRVRAATRNDLFSEAARAMFMIMFRTCTDKGYREKIVVEGSDCEELLHDFLSELLYVSEIKGIAFCQVAVSRPTGKVLMLKAGASKAGIPTQPT
jgi:SHS2 domain-containing protein